MKVRDLATVEHQDGRTHRASSWSAEDTYDYRTIYHYTTPMLRIHQYPPSWSDGVEMLSVGWGSVTDQQGVNQILQELGSTLIYVRKGGTPRIMDSHPQTQGQVFP